MRAAAYIANSSDASVGMEPAGTTTSGRKIAAMVKPVATRTLIAVTSEASRIACQSAKSGFVQVFGRRDDDRLCTLKRPAFEKRQGRKSRSVVRGGSTGSMVI